MKIPDKIRIQGMEYGIEQVAGLSNGINRLLGEVQHATLRIRLDAEQEPQRAAVTLWHEILHAVIEHAGLDLGTDVEERVADTMAFGVYQILEDNIERLYPSVASLPSAEGVEASAGSGTPSVGCADSSGCGARNSLLAYARRISTAAPPYCSLYPPQAAHANVPPQRGSQGAVLANVTPRA